MLIDSFDRGISIGELENVHRYLNEELDKENNDFELTVSSPGMDQPFKVMEQYKKNIGKEVEVKLMGGSKLKGILQSQNSEGIVLHTREKKKVEGSKKKEWIEEDHELPFSEILETRKTISFK